MKAFKVGILLVLCFVLVLASSVPAYAAKPSGSAANFEVVKKGGVKGNFVMGPPAKGPKPSASTGVLGQPVTGSRYAILVGIADYPGVGDIWSGGLDLNYSDDDAILMKQTLMAAYGFTESNITLLVDRDGSRANILAAIASLKGRVGPNDEVVFFYSGHGAKYNMNSNGVGGGKVGIAVWGWENPQDPNDIYLEAISDKELKEAFNGFKTDRLVFVFDMCVAGGMIDIAAKGGVVLMATTQVGVAAEAFPGEWPYHGFFTEFLVEMGMSYHLADLNGDGLVSVEEAYDFARFGMETFSQQNPPFWQIPTVKDTFKGDLLP